MSNLAKLERPVDPDVERFVEELLEEVKSGATRGICIVTQGPDGIGYATAGLKNRLEISGFLYYTLHRLQGDK